MAFKLPGLGHSDEQIAILDQATGFCRERAPIAAVRARLGQGFDPALFAEMAELGWLGITIPEAHGGIGLTLGEAAMVAEQLGRRLIGLPFASTTIAAQALLAAGGEAAQAQWLPQLAAGRHAALALLEADGNWDLAAARASAVRDGDGWRLAGTKRMVEWAEGAALMLATVQAEGTVRLALVPGEALAGATMRREKIVDETRASWEVTLDGITVPADALLPVQASADALSRMELATGLLTAAEMVGGTQAVMDYTLDYLRTRKQFGKLIGEYQALKHPMVDIYVDYEKARSLMLSAAWVIDRQGEAPVAVHMAMAAASRLYSHAADRAIQFHGGFGFTRDCDAGLYRRNAIWQATRAGDAHWHRAKLKPLLFA